MHLPLQAQGSASKAGPRSHGSAQSASGQAPTRAGAPGGQQPSGHRRRGGRGGGGGNGGGGGADEGAAASLELAARFPPPQRLFVLFLEAADSHRFNAHLAQCACCPAAHCPYGGYLCVWLGP